MGKQFCTRGYKGTILVHPNGDSIVVFLHTMFDDYPFFLVMGSNRPLRVCTDGVKPGKTGGIAVEYVNLAKIPACGGIFSL